MLAVVQDEQEVLVLHLRRDRGTHRVFGGGEGGLGAVTDGLVEHPVMRGDEAIRDGQVSRHGQAHSGAVLLPQRSTAFNILEQKGDLPLGRSGMSNPEEKERKRTLDVRASTIPGNVSSRGMAILET